MYMYPLKLKQEVFGLTVQPWCIYVDTSLQTKNIDDYNGFLYADFFQIGVRYHTCNARPRV